MRKPQEIVEEIRNLKKELKLSREYHEYVLLYADHQDAEDMICFFNMKKARVILTALVEEKQLQLRHEAYGNVNVYMNPQRNRILVINNNNNKHISEDNILNFIIWSSGDWYLKE
jgi:hypothetical protein